MPHLNVNCEWRQTARSDAHTHTIVQFAIYSLFLFLCKVHVGSAPLYFIKCKPFSVQTEWVHRLHANAFVRSFVGFVRGRPTIFVVVIVVVVVAGAHTKIWRNYFGTRCGDMIKLLIVWQATTLLCRSIVYRNGCLEYSFSWMKFLICRTVTDVHTECQGRKERA